MVSYTTTLLKFGEKGEKTGWTYLEVPADLADTLQPNSKQIFRVKGTLDNFPIKLVALLPMGNGGFIMPVNAEMRKGLHKKEGAMIEVKIEIDTDPVPPSEDLLVCLADEPEALAFFQQLTKGHQNYFSKWIESAKTPETKAKRIGRTIQGLAMKMDYGQMIRYFKDLDSKLR
jgi:hypothetical protein